MSTENTTPIYGAPVGLPFVSNLFQEAYAIAEESLKKSAEANEKYAACVEATAQAQVAANKANAIRGNLEAGGYIESLKELNNNEKFTAWVGSLAEYEAETEKRVNCLYIIEDEPIPVDYIVEQGTKDIWTYRKWASGVAECWGRKSSITTVEWDAMCSRVDVPLPFKFVDTPMINCSGHQQQTNSSYVAMAIATSDTASGYIKCQHEPSEEYTCWFNFDIKGRWK